MSIFRKAEYDVLGWLIDEFIIQIYEDLEKTNDGYLYVFDNKETEFGVNCGYKLYKPVEFSDQIKQTDNTCTLSKIIMLTDVSTGESVSVNNVFDRSYRSDKHPIGYCVTLNDADIIKCMRIKSIIDDFVKFVGYDDLSEFVKRFERLKSEYPEKFV